MKILFMLTVFSGLCGVFMAQQKKVITRASGPTWHLLPVVARGPGFYLRCIAGSWVKRKNWGPV